MKKMVPMVIIGIMALSICASALAKPMMGKIEKPRTDKICRLKILGKWGYIGDNETKGYFVAKIKRVRRALVIRGMWNTTDNTEKGRIFGVVKRCYFNGIIRTANKTIPVIGLLKIDRNKHIMRMKWMTPQGYGWAVGKIKVERPSI